MTRLPGKIEAAYRRLHGHVRTTPVIDLAGAEFGHDADIRLKLELLQYSGSFKTRGAFNNLLTRSAPAAGVAAASGGNHGAAVAFAARSLGVPARIFVPATSSPTKIARIRETGAEIHVEGARYADALHLCERYRAETGALDIHAYDAPETIEGQGTAALEWERQRPDLDTVLVAVGGGGLIAGVAGWFQGRVMVIGVEPTGSRALHAALEAGRPVDVPVESIAADSLGAKRTGDHVLEIARTHVSEVVLVEDDDILEAQARLWTSLRIAAEPGGAAALSALTSGAYRPAPGERIGVLVCGGNLDPRTLAGPA